PRERPTAGRHRRRARGPPHGDGLRNRGARSRQAVDNRRRRRRGGLLPRLLRDAGPTRRVKADKIYLVGFMAAGKTTVARALAKRLDWPAVDVDERIEEREHLSVAEIFAKRGEPYFRATERAVLAEQLAPRHLVVATGGGSF